jgi:hypothetical protein
MIIEDEIIITIEGVVEILVDESTEVDLTDEIELTDETEIMTVVITMTDETVTTIDEIIGMVEIDTMIEESDERILVMTITMIDLTEKGPDLQFPDLHKIVTLRLHHLHHPLLQLKMGILKKMVKALGKNQKKQ